MRGSFTGAVQDKVGRFQAAEKGTIFLDEIGDISPRIQLKLLRGLERKEFERVGDNKTYYADVRVVAATNVDLMQKVREGVFREDLYYRLKVVTLPLPPLRERKEDIPLLVEHFLGMSNQLEAYYRDNAGRLGEQQVRADLKAFVRNARFDNGNYLFVEDKTGSLVVHPARPDLEGTEPAKDKNGKPFAVEMVRIGMKDGKGMLTYAWPKPGEDAPKPKVAYFRYLPDLGWLVGTGAWAEDIEAEMKAEALKQIANMGRTDLFV